MSLKPLIAGMSQTAGGGGGGAPSGPAGGDLGGTYPNPTVAKIAGVTVSGTPSAGQVPIASDATTAAWGDQTGGSGAPQLPAWTYTSGTIGDGLFTTDNGSPGFTTSITFGDTKHLLNDTVPVGTTIVLTAEDGTIGFAVIAGVSVGGAGATITFATLSSNYPGPWDGNYTVSFIPAMITTGQIGAMNVTTYDPRGVSYISGHINGANPTGGGILNMDVGAGAGSLGGNVSTYGGGTGAAAGGNLDTHGDASPGGSIDTSDGGGSINTRAKGLIELGIVGTRTSLIGTATADRAIAYPDASGIVALAADITLSAILTAAGITTFAQFLALFSITPVADGTVSPVISGTTSAGIVTALS